MTRTARAIYPRALTRDRSESKSGLDKSTHKHGAGTHNWGSLQDEAVNEFYATHIDAAEEYYSADEDTFPTQESHDQAHVDDTSSAHSNELEEQQVPKTRKRAASNSVTESDRAYARSLRKNSFKGQLDLAAIARTSHAVSQSPPKDTTLSSASRTTKHTITV